MQPDVIKTTLARTYKDKFWDGIDVTPAALKVDLTVARDAGLLQDSSNPATSSNILDLSYLPKGR